MLSLLWVTVVTASLRSNRTQTRTVLNAAAVQQQLVSKTFGWGCSRKALRGPAASQLSWSAENMVCGLCRTVEPSSWDSFCVPEQASGWQFWSGAGKRERTGNEQVGTALESCVIQSEAGGSYHVWFWPSAELAPSSKALGIPGFWGSAEGHCHCLGNIHETKRRGGLDNRLPNQNYSYFGEVENETLNTQDFSEISRSTEKVAVGYSYAVVFVFRSSFLSANYQKY